VAFSESRGADGASKKAEGKEDRNRSLSDCNMKTLLCRKKTPSRRSGPANLPECRNFIEHTADVGFIEKPTQYMGTTILGGC
jgi:hypothetical protein